MASTAEAKRAAAVAVVREPNIFARLEEEHEERGEEKESPTCAVLPEHGPRQQYIPASLLGYARRMRRRLVRPNQQAGESECMSSSSWSTKRKAPSLATRSGTCPRLNESFPLRLHFCDRISTPKRGPCSIHPYTLFYLGWRAR